MLFNSAHVDAALVHLLELVRQGVEYPDAEWKVLCDPQHRKVSGPDLQCAYDDYCADPIWKEPDVEYLTLDDDGEHITRPLVEGRWYIGRYGNRGEYDGERNCALWRLGQFWAQTEDTPGNGYEPVEMHDYDYLVEAADVQR